MLNLIDIFESIEQFAYKVLIWMLIAPKTLAKIIVDPDWAAGYITKELREKEHNRFDDFFSPVILILLVSVVPFVYFSYFTVTPSASISAPTAAHLGEDVILAASADFISDVPPYRFEWKDGSLKPLPVNYSGEDGSVIWIAWDEPGIKSIYVVASNQKGEKVWARSAHIYIGKAGEDLSRFKDVPTPEPSNNYLNADFGETLKETNSALLGLLFLGIPLIFALVVEVILGNPLSGEGMKRSFFIQCYYFAPLYTALWAGLVAPQYFLTPSESPLASMLLSMFLYFLGWLIYHETRLLEVECKFHWVKALGTTLGILTASTALVIALVAAGELKSTYPDLLRLGSWLIWVGLGLILIVMGWARALKSRSQGKASPNHPRS
jgi:hypothetical protein